MKGLRNGGVADLRKEIPGFWGKKALVRIVKTSGKGLDGGGIDVRPFSTRIRRTRVGIGRRGGGGCSFRDLLAMGQRSAKGNPEAL